MRNHTILISLFFVLTASCTKPTEYTVIDLNDAAVIETLAKNNNGKVVYVDVWATWCGYCLQEFPKSVALHKELDANKIVFAYVAVDSEKKEWERIIKKKRLSGQHILLNKEQAEEFGDKYFNKENRGIPQYMIIDKNGRLINTDAPRPSNKEIKKMLMNLMEK